MATVQRLTEKMWPGIAVIPTMSAGGGVHGLNERLLARSLYEGQAFLYELALTLAQ